VDNQEYGINVLAVNGILRAKKFKIQLLPGMPKSIEGIINLRGQIKYLYNLRNKFHLQDETISDESKFIMLNICGSIAGWIVDEVTDIVKMDDKNLEIPPNCVNDSSNHYIKSIGKIDERLIIILDPEKILVQEDLEDISIPDKLVI